MVKTLIKDIRITAIKSYELYLSETEEHPVPNASRSDSSSREYLLSLISRLRGIEPHVRTADEGNGMTLAELLGE